MTKRLFSTDKRSEKILSHLRAKGENVSAYISRSVVDETLPVYSDLRTEALYLLDLITDGAKDFKGYKLNVGTGESEISFFTRRAIGRGIRWLKLGHHIKKCDVLKYILNCYHDIYFSDDTDPDILQAQSIGRSDSKNAFFKLKEIDPFYNGDIHNICGIARDVLDHWDKLWDWDGSYDLILSVIYSEKAPKAIDPFVTINILRELENQYILEAIGEEM